LAFIEVDRLAHAGSLFFFFILVLGGISHSFFFFSFFLWFVCFSVDILSAFTSLSHSYMRATIPKSAPTVYLFFFF